MSRRDSGDSAALIFGGVPRASLMPPEVELRRKERGRRRGLIAATIGVLALTVTGVVGSYLFAAAAEQQLNDARITTEQLLATQLEYSEVIQVQNQIAAVNGVRSTLSAVEVLWQPTLAPYLAVFSADEIVESVSFSGDSPAEPPLGVDGPLREPRVATVSVVITTALQPEPWRWFQAWEKIDTFADASIDSIVQLGEGHETRLTLNLSESALSQRFSAEEVSP